MSSSNDLKWEEEASELQTEAKVHTVFIIQHSFLYNYIFVHFLFLVLEHSHSDEIKEHAGEGASMLFPVSMATWGHLIQLPH